MVKNPPANAEDASSSPGLGRFHMSWSNQARVPQLLSLHSRAHEPQLLKPACLEPVLCNKRSHRSKKPRTATKSSPASPQLEKAPAQQCRPNAAKNNKTKHINRTSLVAQWLRIHLPMQGTRVQVLVWEDPTCRGVTKTVHRNY